MSWRLNRRVGIIAEEEKEEEEEEEGGGGGVGGLESEVEGLES